MIFITEDGKQTVFSNSFSQKLCKNAFIQSKLAHKRPKWSNSIKIKTKSKMSKTATKCKKTQKSDFRDQIQNQNLFKKKKIFD